MNLAQSDPYYIPRASQDGRLALVRSRGPLSGGTIVRVVKTDRNYQNMVVEAPITRVFKRDGMEQREVQQAQVEVVNNDLVVLRRR